MLPRKILYCRTRLFLMGWSSILQKFTRSRPASPRFRDQGDSHRGEPNPKVEKPFPEVSSSHGGNYDPNDKKKAFAGSHGGDYDPNPHEVYSSERRNEHGRNYSPSRTADDYSSRQGLQPRPSDSGGRNIESRKSSRSGRRAHRDTATR